MSHSVHSFEKHCSPSFSGKKHLSLGSVSPVQQFKRISQAHVEICNTFVISTPLHISMYFIKYYFSEISNINLPPSPVPRTEYHSHPILLSHLKLQNDLFTMTEYECFFVANLISTMQHIQRVKICIELCHNYNVVAQRCKFLLTH